MKRFRDMPLYRKLTSIVVGTVLVAMLIASVGIVHYEGVAARRFMVNELDTTADIIGINSAVYLRFESKDKAENLLQSLRSKEHVVRACLFDADKQMFAEYRIVEDLEEAADPQLGNTHAFTAEHLHLSRRIVHDGDILGIVHLTSDLTFLHDQRRQAIATTALVLAGSTILALLLSLYWMRAASRPVTDLMKTSSKVSITGDYSLRAVQFADDDLGQLTASFNRMLGQIQERDAKLHQTQDELEKRLKELAAEKDRLTKARERERELEEKLSRSERLESLGLLAGGVAHDLNNILGPMVAYPELILELLPEEDTRLRHMMQQIKESGKKASGVIRNLLTMGRRGSYDLEVVDLNKIVRSYANSPELADVQRNYSKADLRLELAEDLWPIQASVPHLNQVVMNLVINAFESLGRSDGEVLVRTERAGVNKPIDGYHTIEQGLYVKLTVTDTGCGIPPEKIGRIFEPFYTGKKMGRSGSGLGLAVVYGVIQDFDGQIDVRSEPGEGTSFELYFPPMLEATATRKEPELDLHGSESILIIDDVREQREMAAELLETMGYATNVAEHGHAAVEFLKENDADLIVLDMIMEEGFDGLDTYREILKFKPRQKCIIASGFSENERGRECQRLGAGAYVSKPYTRSTIGRAVRDELERQRNGT